MSVAYASMQHLADALEQANRELDSLVDRIVTGRPKRWIAQSVQGHPYRITDGCRDFGQYATYENAKRALAEMGA